MNKKRFMLSCDGLKNIIFRDNNLTEDFQFVFGKNIIKMNRFLAEFISPHVSRLHQSDLTINTLFLDKLFQIPNQSIDFLQDSNLINNFEQISKGNSIEINEEMSHKLRILSILIENKEIYEKIDELFPISTEEENLDTCVQYLQYLDVYKKYDFYFKTINNQEIVDFISSHFYSIEKTKLLKLPKSILYSIISNQHLKLKDEDSLLDFINQIFIGEKNSNDDFLNIISFYELIELESLSEIKFNEFINKIKSNEMTHLLWEKFKEYFQNHFMSKLIDGKKERYLDRIYTKENEKCITIEFNNDLNNRFNGIIFHLGNGNPKSVVDEEKIKIIASSYYSNNYPKYIVDFDDNFTNFQSSNKANSWICYDFKESKVRPSCYSIRSNSLGDKCWFHPQSWCIEGSNDYQNWKILDDRKNETSLNSKSATDTFKIQNILNKNEFYRFLRIRQTDVNTKNNHCLILSSLEFFGSITSI